MLQINFYLITTLCMLHTQAKDSLSRGGKQVEECSLKKANLSAEDQYGLRDILLKACVLQNETR